MAEAGYKGKRIEVVIYTDTYKIRGTLFVSLGRRGCLQFAIIRFS